MCVSQRPSAIILAVGWFGNTYTGRAKMDMHSHIEYQMYVTQYLLIFIYFLFFFTVL